MRLLLIFAMMGWGLVWPLAKIMVEVMPPEHSSFFRFFIVALSFLPIMWYLKIPFWIPKPALLPLMLTGICNVIYSYLMYVGLQYGHAGSAGVIAEVLSPILAAFLWSFIHKTHLLKCEKWGLFFGILAGAFLVNLFGNFSAILSAFNIIYLLASLVWACLMIASHYATKYITAIALNFYTSCITFVCFLPTLFLYDSTYILDIGLDFWCIVLLAALFCTTFSTTIYYKALSVLGITQGGIYALLVPLFALGFSWAILGEVPQWYTIIGGIIAIFAIYLMNYFGRIK